MLSNNPDPMPTGDRSWTGYHMAAITGRSGFAAFLVGFAFGGLAASWTTESIPPGLAALVGGALMLFWHARRQKRHAEKMVEIEAERAGAQWEAREAETQRQIAEMQKRNRFR